MFYAGIMIDLPGIEVERFVRYDDIEAWVKSPQQDNVVNIAKAMD